MFSPRYGGLNGLGEVDGFWKDVGKTFKTFGLSTIRVATAGMYDPSKNRFLVPFTGAQVRNATSGAIGVTTGGIVGSGGIVNTDRFMNSKTGKVLGNVGAAVQAAVVGGAAMNYFSTPPSGAASPSLTQTAPSTYSSSVPSASSLAPSAFAEPTLSMHSVGPSGWGSSVIPSTSVTAPTASFATAPTAANAFGAAAPGPAPALLQPFGADVGSGWSFPSGDTLARSAMTTLTVADTVSRIMGRAAGDVQTGGTSVYAGSEGQQPLAYPAMYTPNSGGGGGGGYGDQAAIDDGSMLPWLAVGGVAAVIGFIYLRKK